MRITKLPNSLRGTATLIATAIFFCKGQSAFCLEKKNASNPGFNPFGSRHPCKSSPEEPPAISSSFKQINVPKMHIKRQKSGVYWKRIAVGTLFSCFIFSTTLINLHALQVTM